MTFQSVFSSRTWLITLAIIAVGMSFRALVITNIEYSSASSYSTMQKVTLNFRDFKPKLKAEAGKWQDGQSLVRKYYGLEGGKVDFRELKHQLEASNHPPLHYVFLHLITAAAGQSPPLIINGLMFNLLVSLLTLVVFYKLCLDVFDSKSAANFGLALFAFSLSPLFPLTMQKGYTMQVFFIVVQLGLIIRHFDLVKLKWPDYLLFFLACLGGFLTHYYSYVFTAILCLIATFHYLLVQPNVRRLISYALITLAAALAAICIYPHVFDDVLGHRYATDIQQRMVDPGAIRYSAGRFISEVRQIFSLPLLVLCALVLTVVISQRLRTQQLSIKNITRERYKALYVLAFGMIGFALIQVYSRPTGLRYAAPVIPMLLLSVVFLCNLLLAKRKLFALLCVFFVLGYSSLMLTMALVHVRASKAIVDQWFIDNPVDQVAEDEPVLVWTESTAESFQPAFFLLPPREVAISLTNLDLTLLEQRPNAVVMLHKSVKDRDAAVHTLEELGFRQIEKIRYFSLHRKTH